MRCDVLAAFRVFILLCFVSARVSQIGQRRATDRTRRLLLHPAQQAGAVVDVLARRDHVPIVRFDVVQADGALPRQRLVVDLAEIVVLNARDTLANHDAMQCARACSGATHLCWTPARRHDGARSVAPLHPHDENLAQHVRHQQAGQLAPRADVGTAGGEATRPALRRRGALS